MYPCSVPVPGSCDPDLTLTEASCETCRLVSRAWIGPCHTLSAENLSGLKLMEIGGFVGSETVCWTDTVSQAHHIVTTC